MDSNNSELRTANVSTQSEILWEYPDACGDDSEGYTLTERGDLEELLLEIPHMFIGMDADDLKTITTSAGPIRALRIVQGTDGKKEIVLVV